MMKITHASHIPTLQDAKLQEISMYRNGRNVMLNLMHIGCWQLALPL